MLSSWSDSAWRRRLAERLEPLLKSPDLAKEISTYQGVPFALFAYPPTAEREVRKEVQMLATRIETETGRKAISISMADLLWQAIRTAYPPDGKGLFEAERSFSYEEPKKRLEMLEADMSLVREKSLRLTQVFCQVGDQECADFGFEITGPRDLERRGSQVSLTHAEGYPITRALIARGVIGDFRAPDILRFGLTPLYLRYTDLWDGIQILKDIMAAGTWDAPEFKVRTEVT